MLSNLGKLKQVLAAILWSGRWESNPRQPAWKAGALPLSYSRRNRIYFNPKFPTCQKGVPASSKTELFSLIDGYCLCAQSEAKSPKTIEMVSSSVRYLGEFLYAQGLSTDVVDIGANEIRMFIVRLQQKNRFATHPYAKPQQGKLSGHTVNCYLRSIRAFWSWLISEGIVASNPFHKVKIPKPPRKIIPTFAKPQLQTLLNVIDTSNREGYRDMAVILVLLDTGLRVSELTSLTLNDIRLTEGVLKVPPVPEAQCLPHGNPQDICCLGRCQLRWPQPVGQIGCICNSLEFFGAQSPMWCLSVFPGYK